MTILFLALFFTTAAGFLPNLPTTFMLLFSAGGFFISFGEKMNHYTYTSNLPIHHTAKGSYMQQQTLYIRRETTAGWCLTSSAQA